MMDTRDTRKQILDLAEDLLLDRGYNGFSYKDISVALGIKTASIHYHYPRKTDLGVEIVQRAIKRFNKWAQLLDNRNLGCSRKLDEFCLLFKGFTSRQQVCLGGALQTDFKTLPEEIQQKSCELTSSFLRWLEQLLKEGRDTGAFLFRGEARDQAVLIMSSLQGSVQMDRVTAKSSYRSAVRQITLSISP
jgi:AcrR family transcriptional regulator